MNILQIVKMLKSVRISWAIDKINAKEDNKGAYNNETNNNNYNSNKKNRHTLHMCV